MLLSLARLHYHKALDVLLKALVKVPGAATNPLVSRLHITP